MIYKFNALSMRYFSVSLATRTTGAVHISCPPNLVVTNLPHSGVADKMNDRSGLRVDPTSRINFLPLLL
jgi:hypothetical protein